MLTFKLIQDNITMHCPIGARDHTKSSIYTMNATTTSPQPEPPDLSSMHIDTPPNPNQSATNSTPLTFAQTLLANN